MSTVQRLAEQAQTLGWTMTLGTATANLTKGDAYIGVDFRKDGKINRAFHRMGVDGSVTRITGGLQYVFTAMQRLGPSDEWQSNLDPMQRREQAQKIVTFKAWPRDPVEVCLIATAAWGPFNTDRQRYAACVRGLKEAELL